MSSEILEQAFATTAGVLANVTPDDMDLDTPCASWKVRDLVNHIVRGSYYFAAVAENGVPPDGHDRPDFTSGAFTAAFAAGSAQAVAAFGAPGALDKTMTLPFGELPGSVFMMIAATDTFAHGWDLARATGQPSDLDPELAEQLLAFARTALRDGFRGPEGKSFGPVVEVPETAPAADRLAGFLGRQP